MKEDINQIKAINDYSKIIANCVNLYINKNIITEEEKKNKVTELELSVISFVNNYGDKKE